MRTRFRATSRARVSAHLEATNVALACLQASVGVEIQRYPNRPAARRLRPPMGKYTRLLTPEEYNALSTDERIEYISDAAEILRGSRPNIVRQQQQQQQQQPEGSPDPDRKDDPPETHGAK